MVAWFSLVLQGSGAEVRMILIRKGLLSAGGGPETHWFGGRMREKWARWVGLCQVGFNENRSHLVRWLGLAYGP